MVPLLKLTVSLVLGRPVGVQLVGLNQSVATPPFQVKVVAHNGWISRQVASKTMMRGRDIIFFGQGPLCQVSLLSETVVTLLALNLHVNFIHVVNKFCFASGFARHRARETLKINGAAEA
jgi:hypothetical protein